MKGLDVRPTDLLMLGGVAVGLYLLWQGMKAAKDVVTSAASAANDATASVVSGIGSAVGLPTTSQTLHDPRQVRWIIDHVGDFAASKWGTAAAFYSALFSLNAGDGDQSPPPADVLAALGVSVSPADTFKQTGAAVVGLMTGAPTDPAGPSFNDVVTGKVDPYNTFHIGT